VDDATGSGNGHVDAVVVVRGDAAAKASFGRPGAVRQIDEVSSEEAGLPIGSYSDHGVFGGGGIQVDQVDRPVAG